MYVLGALEPTRYQLQILHEHDDCCFRARGAHESVRAYNAIAQRHVGGWMQTAVTQGDHHEVR